MPESHRPDDTTGDRAGPRGGGRLVSRSHAAMDDDGPCMAPWERAKPSNDLSYRARFSRHPNLCTPAR